MFATIERLRKSFKEVAFIMKENFKDDNISLGRFPDRFPPNTNEFCDQKHLKNSLFDPNLQ